MPDGTTKTTRYLGKAYERTLTVAPGGSTTTEDRYFIHAAGRLVAVHTENRTDNQARNRFLHRDALGTVTLITDALGQVVERYAFRPFGERAVIEPPGDAPGWTIPAGVTPRLKRGFTGHEHIEGVGLIHMNGRVYDPRLGRFLSADPNVQFIDQPRSYNRYVYAQNNPLKYSDPSGYFISVVVAIAFQYAASAVIGNTLAAAFVAGFMTGLVLSGGDLKAAFRGGVFATLSAGWARGLGGHWGGGLDLQGPAKALAHGMTQGIISEAAGGGFQSGFVGAFTGSLLEGVNIRTSDEGRVVMAAVAGGTVSELSGGKFANGAVTAAFAYAFSSAARQAEDPGRPLTDDEKAVARDAYGDKIKDYDDVRVYDRRFLPFQGKHVAMAPNGNIYWPAASSCSDLTSCTITAADGFQYSTRRIFVHEMGHVMQHQQGINVMLRALPHQIWRGITFGAYDPYMSHSEFLQTPSPSGLNVEAQADWYMHSYCTRTRSC